MYERGFLFCFATNFLSIFSSQVPPVRIHPIDGQEYHEGQILLEVGQYGFPSSDIEGR